MTYFEKMKAFPFSINFTSTVGIATFLFMLIMFGIALFIGYSIAKWLRDYKIFQFIFAKIMRKSLALDKIRRVQMQTAFKKKSDIMANSNEKPTLLQKLYRAIQMSGVVEAIPGFSENSFLVFLSIANLMLFSVVSFQKSILVGLVLTVIFNFAIYYLLEILSYRRAVSVEDQMIDFVNLIASTSRQYSNIIDIFGVIYEEFSNPFQKALEECYVEAKQNNHTEVALEHLKDKFDSNQFEFVIDNLSLCSKENGQYFSVAMDISKISGIYYASYQKKKSILRQSKMNLSLMFFLAIGILFMMSNFIGGGMIAMITSTSGIILSSLMVALYLYAMNMKAR